jgi:hypothetical protein
MKYIIILAILLASCSNDGVETVKTTDGLKVKTTSMYSNTYPEYVKGDTVIIWRAIQSRSSNWYISVTDVNIHESDLIEFKKGVIQ